MLLIFINKLLKLNFFLVLIVLIFLFGFLTNKYKLYPYNHINSLFKEIKYSINYEVFKKFKSIFFFFSSDKDASMFLDLNDNYKFKFYNNSSANLDYFQYDTYFISTGNQAVLFDNINNSILFNISSEKIAPHTQYIDILPNKNLIASNDKNGTLYIVNSSNELIHSYDNLFPHHWGSIDGNSYFLPGRLKKKYEILKDIMPNIYNSCADQYENFWDDTIIEIDVKSGVIKDITSLSEIFLSSLQVFEFETTNCIAPFHLNDIEFFKVLNSKKIILSLRNNNSLLILNKKNYSFEKLIFGEFRQQHSPRVVNNSIYIFDNHPYLNIKTSRVIEIDFEGNTLSQYNGNNEHILFSDIMGMIDFYDNKLILTSSNQGEVWMLDCLGNDLNECKSDLIYSTNKKYSYPYTFNKFSSINQLDELFNDIYTFKILKKDFFYEN